MKRTITTLFISLILVTVNYSQSELNTRFDELFSQLLVENRPGLSISILHEGETIYSEGFGMANLEHNIPFNPNTVSDLGSVSKQLTTFGIIMLHHQGKLSVDDDIHEYIDELPDFGHKVTVRNLIHHTSGIPDVYALHSLIGMRPGDHVSQSDALHLLKKRPVLDFLPGSQYRYSNTGYMLLAEIIEKVTGSEFEEWMQANIFQPLQMTHTGIMNVQGEIFPMMADSYISTDSNSYKKIYDNSTLQGGGGVYSTGTDMLKWIDNLRTSKVGNEEIFKIFLQQAVLNDGTKIDYAGGINVDTYRGINRYTHNGSSAGYRTKMAYYPDFELGLMIKSNTPELGYVTFDIIEDIIIESLIDENAPKDPKKSENDPIAIDSTANDIELKQYTGNYFSEQLDLTISVEATDTSLILSNFFYTIGNMRTTGIDTFSQGGNQVLFIRDGKEKIVSMEINTPRASGIKLIKRKS